jgi:hypothetical protein
MTTARTLRRPPRSRGDSVLVASLVAGMAVAGLALKVSSAMEGMSVADMVWRRRSTGAGQRA